MLSTDPGERITLKEWKESTIDLLKEALEVKKVSSWSSAAIAADEAQSVLISYYEIADDKGLDSK